MKVEFTEEPTAEQKTILQKGIEAEAAIAQPISEFGFFFKEKGRVIAGCNGTLIYGALYIDQLWVEPTRQRQGLGTKLMQQVEGYAQKKDCSLIFLHTMSWEAQPFYEKLGYKLYSKLDGFEGEHFLISLVKKIPLS